MTQSWTRDGGYQGPTESDEEKLVYQAISEHENCSLSDLVHWLNLKEADIQIAASRLERSAKIRVNKFGRTTRYAVW